MPAPLIRPADAACDAAAIAAIYSPSVTGAATSFEVEPPDAAEMAARITRIAARFPWLVCERGGEVLGYVYAGAHRERAAYRWAVDVAVYIDERQHRTGIGRALYTSLFALLRLQGFYVACAGITLPNPGSVCLHEALGFELVGIYKSIGYKAGAWRDVGWWQLALRESSSLPAPAASDAAPAEPLAFSELHSHPGYGAALAAGSPLLK